ncbi:hypothetical protein [Streptomyces broussonetiae]|uniref:Uncharacterized protein n=1 Tax=Streptomyces broussonetiae TaxID=2686304 RepID=A0A6I6N1Z4_9ACTN|nr:hypothetical protein [Streptomyces broussonetiae]QHA02206.1 hypothetical protein GQF42_01655 [Streptomyces broussonetiae]
MVKQIVDGPDADERYAREVAALRLAARAENPVVPALLAIDPGERVERVGLCARVAVENSRVRTRIRT